MLTVAIYARFSSDHQRDASIADQLRVCRLHAEQQGWQVVEEYTDHAISGASLLRPGIQALISDATRGRFRLVLSEAIDRLSRDQEDIAGFYKRMSHADVKIVTLSEGDVTHLHIGLKGTMNALFLQDLAAKTRRGLRGRVEQGKSGGGRAYGYDVIRHVDHSGNPVRGDRAINESQAEVIRRIFRDYAAGKSPKRIATELNADGIPAPSGSEWGFSTINGNIRRANGILNNEMYVGRLIWNRQRFLKDPDTGKRQARPNQEADWVVQEVPDLRIIDDELWQAVKTRQLTLKHDRRSADGDNHFRDRRRPRYLLSGLTYCGCCGGGYAMISADLVGCSTARNKGTCKNRMNIRRDRLEARVLDALRHHLMDPALFREFCDEFTREMNRLRIEGRASLVSAQAELKRIERDLGKLMDLYLKDAMPLDIVKQRSAGLETRRAELIRLLDHAEDPPVLLHPNMAVHYRKQVERLHTALQDKSTPDAGQAVEAMRSLIEAIVLTPINGTLAIDVRGDLAGILRIASSGRTKTPALDGSGVGAAFAAQFEMVAGTGFEPVTFRL